MSVLGWQMSVQKQDGIMLLQSATNFLQKLNLLINDFRSPNGESNMVGLLWWLTPGTCNFHFFTRTSKVYFRLPTYCSATTTPHCHNPSTFSFVSQSVQLIKRIPREPCTSSQHLSLQIHGFKKQSCSLGKYFSISALITFIFHPGMPTLQLQHLKNNYVMVPIQHHAF